MGCGAGARRRGRGGRRSARRLASNPAAYHDPAMLNLASLLIGVVALLLAIPAFLPFLGWANWLIIPLAVVGLVLGMLSSRKSGRNLNLVVIVIGVIRLMLGGGIF